MDTLNEPIIESDNDGGSYDDFATNQEDLDPLSSTRNMDMKDAALESNPQAEEENNDEVQVLSPQQAEREFRRKRRRLLYRLLKRPDKPPSFLAVLEAEPKDDDDDDYEIPPPMVVVDVDAYLGFKAKEAVLPHIVPSNALSSSGELPPRRARTSTSDHPSPEDKKTLMITTPAEEGWYEGSRIMAMPEDSTFLGDLHVWVRQHLEFFSATELDVQQSQAGRRTKAVRGKVGIRCIHCARNILPKLQTGNTKVSWPPGAVTFPLNFAGLYSGASQKPQLHFETCPYLPQDSALATMLQEARANQQGTANLTGMGKRKRMVQGISGIMFYAISCERIGLREIGNQGLRFTRDLSLEPLDFETVRIQVEREHPDLIPRQYQNNPVFSSLPPMVNKVPRLGLPDAPTSSDAVSVASQNSSMNKSSCLTTQAVLQKALAEADDPNHRLIRRSDKNILTDYMFLAIAQMAICHATKEDFGTRGKKTKMMRMGFTGFCCRHCIHANSGYSCRSFSSAPDNLASAISNSFVLHLQKCPYTPPEIKLALASTKKVHTKQMAQLPYGGQRRMFFEMWDRMRAADKPPPEGDDQDDDDIEESEGGQGDEDWNPDMDNSKDNDDDNHADADKAKPSATPSTVATSIVVDANRPNARDANFPVVNDAETQAALKSAEAPWDPAINDHLIMPEDRYLVSDYVFLTMRQLKVAMPSPDDFRGNRRNNIVSRMPGLCCIHCAHDPTFNTPSGRSFPSAPDNMACALNSSFYNHMQHCPHLDESVKRALVHLRKIHSQQCSSLTFGSQRRFFTKVYDKLKQIPMTDEQVASFSAGGLNSGTPKSGGTSKSNRSFSRRDNKAPVVDDQVFREHNFVAAGTIGIPYWTCLKCRMVPFEFRSIGAVHYARPVVAHLKQHRSVCYEDGLSPGWVNNSIREMFAVYKNDKLGESLRPLIEIVVGNDFDLVEHFMHCIASRGRDEPVPEEIPTRGWWLRLPTSVDWAKVESAFEDVAKALELPSPRLTDHPKILRTLEIMSPCLQVQQADDVASSIKGDQPDSSMVAQPQATSNTPSAISETNAEAGSVGGVVDAPAAPSPAAVPAPTSAEDENSNVDGKPPTGGIDPNVEQSTSS